MIEIRIHGRGGQGGVTLAKLIATTRFLAGESVPPSPNSVVEPGECNPVASTDGRIIALSLSASSGLLCLDLQ